MSTDSKMKKITLEKLDDSSSRVTSSWLKKIGMLGTLTIVAGVGGYFIHTMVSGPTLSSRFTVNNMNCPACVITVKEVTSKMPGVMETDVSLASQSVTVKFHEKKQSAENIVSAIARVGYQVDLDGTYNNNPEENKSQVVAAINGSPLFRSDIAIPLSVDPSETRRKDSVESFFTAVGKQLILQASDKAVIVAQPSEIDDEIRNIFETQTLKEDELNQWIKETYGSVAKFRQVIAQRLAIEKYLEESTESEIEDIEQKKIMVSTLLGSIFKDANVRIYDDKIREQIHARVGRDDWNTFWPRMLSADSELKTLLIGKRPVIGTQTATDNLPDTQSN